MDSLGNIWKHINQGLEIAAVITVRYTNTGMAR